MLLAVDEDQASLREVENELRERYVRDYRVLTAASSHEALERLEELRAAADSCRKKRALFCTRRRPPASSLRAAPDPAALPAMAPPSAAGH